MYDAQRLAVSVEISHPLDGQAAGGRAGRVPLGAGGAAVRDPEVHLDLVPHQDGESGAVRAEKLGEPEHLHVELHGGTLIGDRQRGHGGEEARHE